MLFTRMESAKSFVETHKLIYGPPKIGKTTIASHFKASDGREPLFAMTEDGLGTISVFGVKINSWEGFKKFIELKLKSNLEAVRKEHSSIVLDLASDLDQMCTNHVCKANGVSTLADLAHGKGWHLHKYEFQSALREIMSILPITFICHSKEKEMKVNGETIKVQIPSLSAGAFEYINGKVDLIGFVMPEDGKNPTTLTFRNTTTSLAGSRYQQICKDYPLKLNDIASTLMDIESDFNQGGNQ